VKQCVGVCVCREILKLHEFPHARPTIQSNRAFGSGRRVLTLVEHATQNYSLCADWTHTSLLALLPMVAVATT
jgi:hypothetical protein